VDACNHTAKRRIMCKTVFSSIYGRANRQPCAIISSHIFHSKQPMILPQYMPNVSALACDSFGRLRSCAKCQIYTENSSRIGTMLLWCSCGANIYEYHFNATRFPPDGLSLKDEPHCDDLEAPYFRARLNILYFLCLQCPGATIDQPNM
jgi:hypothetical protein